MRRLRACAFCVASALLARPALASPSATLAVSVPGDLEPTLSPPEGALRHADAFVRLADAARETLDLTAMYWSLRPCDEATRDQCPDEKGLTDARLDELGAADGGKVLDALVRAASRGVSLRILSAPGLTPLGQAEVDEIVAAGAKVTTRTLDMGAWFGSGILHMKLMVADSEQFYTGSANMDWRSMAQTMEVGVLVEGDSAAGADAAGLFARFWALADLDPAKYTTQGFDAQSRVTLKVPCWSKLAAEDKRCDDPLPAGAGAAAASGALTGAPAEVREGARRDDLFTLQDTIRQGAGECSGKGYKGADVRLQVMDYLPSSGYMAQTVWWPGLSDAVLSAAVMGGCDVRMLVACWSDNLDGWHEAAAAIEAQAAVFYKHKRADKLGGSLEVRVLTLPGWNETGKPKSGERRYAGHSRVNHRKYAVAGDVVNVGTSNWLWDYFATTAGASFNLEDASLARQLAELYDASWDSPWALSVDQAVEAVRHSEAAAAARAVRQAAAGAAAPRRVALR